MKFIKINDDIINLENVELFTPSRSYDEGNIVLVRFKSGKESKYSGLDEKFLNNLVQRLDNYNIFLR